MRCWARRSPSFYHVRDIDVPKIGRSQVCTQWMSFTASSSLFEDVPSPLSKEVSELTGGRTDPSKSFEVTPWKVEAKGDGAVMDYRRVREIFKAQPITEEVLKAFAAAQHHAALNSSAKPCDQKRALELHPFFSRGIVFAHRDFDSALCKVPQAPASAYLYTGRGPSSDAMHIGHAVPFMLTRYLQAALGLPVVIQITDDEKFLFRDVPYCGVRADQRVRDNIKDIIAFGFDPQQTFIFRNTSYMGELYPTVLALQRAITTSAARHTLGLSESDNIGKLAFAATQAAPCFATAFPKVLPPLSPTAPVPQCIVPCAVDQDPFFVLARRASHRIPSELRPSHVTRPTRCPPPATVYTTLLPSLKRPGVKMSSTGLSSTQTISLKDSCEAVQQKLRKAFSGGTPSHRTAAAAVDLEADVAYQLLRFFAPEDTLAEVEQRYTSGVYKSVDVKRLCAEVVEREVLAPWRERRAVVDDALVDAFCTVRSIW